MGKDKIYENYRIMSLDGSVIYKSERAKEKVIELASILAQYTSKINLKLSYCILSKSSSNKYLPLIFTNSNP